jgi:hypothetical protein
MGGFNNTQQYIINILGPALGGSLADYKDDKFFKSKEYLKESQKWINALNINSKEDMLKQLNSEKYERYHDFQKNRAKLTILDEEEKEKILQSLDGSDYIFNQYKIIDLYGRRLPSSGIIGYEYLAQINRCRHAYALNYISLEDFWGYSKPIALKCQEKYDSWSQYIFACIVGKMYSVNIKYTSHMRHERFYMKRFITRRYSPIKETPWDMELT